MNNEIKEKIKQLQEVDPLNEDERKKAKNEIFDIIKTLNVDEIRELLGNKTMIHSVCMQKGGVGKSTFTSDLAYTLSQIGYRVLCLDGDPQASLSLLLNVETEDENLYGLQDLIDAQLSAEEDNKNILFDDIKNAIIRPKYMKVVKKGKNWVKEPADFGFDFIPTNLDLAAYDIWLSGRGKAFTLKKIIDVLLDNMSYDFILIDNPPGLNSLGYNYLSCSTAGEILVMNLEPMTVKGAKNLTTTVAEIQRLLWGKKILHKGIIGIIKNQYSPRYKIQRKYDDVIQELFPISTFDNTIPNKSTCDQAHNEGKLYSQFDSKVGQVMKEICYELITEDIRRGNEKEPFIVEISNK